MSVYIVTGKLSNGKTLVTVGRIRDAIISGRRIATNVDINLANMFHKRARKVDLVRIPDKPSIHDLNMIGKGYDGDDYDEEKFGVLVLDECGTWFNSRNWQDKTRKEVNDWFLHSRKLGWHVYIIIQDISILDSQARDAIGELLVVCRRLDKLRIPFLAPIVKVFTGINLTLPRVHRAKVTYADGLLSDVWTYRGNDLFSCYDTRQIFLQDYPHGVHSLLTPWHVYGRYMVEMNRRNVMRLTKIYWKRFASPVALSTGLLLGAFVMLVARQPSMVLPVHVDPVQQVQTPAQPAPVADVKNPFEGAKIYVVGDVSGQLLFQVDFSGGNYFGVTERELRDLGFDVQKVSRGLVKLTFEQELIYAMPKPPTEVASTRLPIVPESIASNVTGHP